MFVHQLLERRDAPVPAGLARISFSSPQGYGAVAAAEVRDLPIAAPGGYAYRPRQGEELAVLGTGDGTVCVGVVARAEELVPGEIKISGPAGSCLYFRADGTVVINGLQITPQGAVLEP